MTPEQIAQAYRSGELDSQTPIWPPGYGGWQALGSIQQLRALAAEPQAPTLSQYDESENDPTRMWMGPEDEYEVEALDAQPQAAAMPSRPASITGPRLVQGPPLPNIPYAGPSAYQRQTGRSGPAPAYSAPAPSNVAPARFGSVASASSRPLSEPPFRSSGGRRWMMIGIGLIGLVGLASAVVLARSGSSDERKVTPVAAKAAEALVREAPAAAAEAVVPAGQKMAEAAPSASQAAADAPKEEEKSAEAKPEQATSAFVANDDAADDDTEATPKKKSRWSRSSSSSSKAKSKWSSKAAAKRQALAETEPKEKVEKAEKPEKAEKADKATAMLPTAGAVKKDGEPADESKSERDAAAAKALTNAASMAASCRPPGGPTGTGKVRVGYNNDGSVGSVEIMTASFAGTTTASCVSMVFRRAKIPAFKGETPTFIKSFTIPE